MKRQTGNFIKDNSNLFLSDTNVENLFINEYMAHAKGDFVKVYLFALMYSGSEEPMNNEIIAKYLGQEVEEVLAAWTYWEKQGVVRKHYKSPDSKLEYLVEFLNLKQSLMHTSIKQTKKRTNLATAIPPELKSTLENQEIKNVFAEVEKIVGRTLEVKELTDILSWIDEDGMEPNLITKTYQYCVQKRGNNSYKYVSSLIKEWREKQFTKAEQMEAHMEETDQRHTQYKRVLKALGMMRYATEEEKRIMDVWFDEMNLSMEAVLDACKKSSGITNPNLKYVNAVLKGRSDEKDGTSRQTKDKKPSAGAIFKSYEKTREKNKQLLETRKVEVYNKIPRIKGIEAEISNLNIQMSKLALSKSSNKASHIESLKNQISELLTEKAYVLTDNEFYPNYLDPIYDCRICKDAGILDTGERCKCFAEKLNT